MSELVECMKLMHGKRNQLKMAKQSQLFGSKKSLQSPTSTLADSYRQLLNSHRDFDEHYNTVFLRHAYRFEHVTSRYRPEFITRKMLVPDDIYSVCHYHYPNDDIQEQVLNYDIGEEYKKIDNKTERLRVFKKMNFQLSKLLHYNNEYNRRKKPKHQDEPQSRMVQVIKIKNNKLRVDQLKSQFDQSEYSSSFITQDTQALHNHSRTTPVNYVGQACLPRGVVLLPKIKIKIHPRSQVQSPAYYRKLSVID